MRKKVIRIIIASLSLMSILVMMNYIYSSSAKENPQKNKTNEIVLKEKDIELLPDEYEYKISVNPEYIGNFKSNLANQNIVQSSDNEKYLNTSWDLKPSTQGAIFVDYRNSSMDQNIILYGHYVYEDETKMFSPLLELIHEENYEKNKYIEIELKDETRKYIITNIYYYDIGDKNLEYFHTQYSEEEFNQYIDAVKSIEFYDTNEEIVATDRFITLQTCVRNQENLRLIIIAKKIK